MNPARAALSRAVNAALAAGAPAYVNVPAVESQAAEVVRLAQAGQLFPERVARAMFDALRGPERVAFVRFDVNGRAYDASPYAPGNWLSPTIRYRLDGKPERVI